VDVAANPGMDHTREPPQDTYSLVLHAKRRPEEVRLQNKPLCAVKYLASVRPETLTE
jgi:hypothetical protein